MEEVKGIQGMRTPIKDVVIIGLGTGKDFYRQSFWMRDPFEWPGTGTRSLNEVSGDLQVDLEGDQPNALGNERKKASM